ncbi:formyl-CoA transferase [Bacillus canaveralius]|uniref:Formyl-CoA transferase n=1 Tax=Bacillus canaveralius TaxID=1403243 RepID=A0A2N5GIA1_9BACI|nr:MULTISPECIES: CoA transferase [Bacillus]PLR80675.1 formyl-CoA transferase [Bacillus canaveralius]PLR83873.1 formyl-CoA transferase [Bacillus sp. V33-4]PLR89092.1 formyl-CoA transferase [Bacillus canaveralius]RSK43133.1 CoA transferase [Bacillus canaveralius]
MTKHRLPLENLRVIELGTLLAGPFAGRLLADFGAEVIKVEPPGKSDPMRNWGKSKDGVGLWWPIQSRNKKSITLNLREEAGQSILRELVKETDIIIENFRPGTMEKWNLSYETLAEINPKIIMVRTSGFGQTGPYKHRAGFGSVGEAMGGLRYVTGYPDRPPSRIGISIGDTLAALFATIGCLVAVHEREHSGKGQVVDTALYESVFSIMESIIPDYLLAGYVRERMGNILPGVAPSNIYFTKDKTYIVIGANADNVFTRLCEAMDQPELADDPRFATHNARGENMKLLDSMIEEWTKTLPAKEALEILEEKGVPSGLIYSAKDILEDPHYKEREMIVNVEHPQLGEFSMPGVVPKLSRTPGKIKHPGAEVVGKHNDEVYRELLGYSQERLKELKNTNVI